MSDSQYRDEQKPPWLSKQPGPVQEKEVAARQREYALSAGTTSLVSDTEWDLRQAFG